MEAAIRLRLGVDIPLGVTGFHDPLRGELVAVVTESSANADLDELRSAAIAVLSEYGLNAAAACRVASCEALPVTSSGKLRRSVLREMLPALEQSVAPTSIGASDKPREPIEQFIAEQIQTILGGVVIGQTDSIFASGFDSLAAVGLLTAVHGKFDVELTLAELLESPRLHELADRIRWRIAGHAKKGLRYLVPLGVRPNRNSAPLFIVGGAYGNVLHLHDLGRHLSEYIDVFGLQYPGLIEGEKPCNSISGIAAKFASEILELGEFSSVCLAGYSGGGIVAIELAKILAAEGIEIDYFAMIDTRLPDSPRFQAPLSIAESTISLVVSLVRRRGQWLARARDLVSGRDNKTATETNGPARLRSLKIHEAFHHGLGTVNIEPCNLELHYFRPTDERRYKLGSFAFDFIEKRPHRIDDFLNGWNNYFSNSMCHWVPGDHYSLIVPPNSEPLAAAIRQTLGITKADSSGSS